MTVVRHQITLATTSAIEIVDITERIRRWLSQQPVRNGLLTILSRHTTARININEREAELQRDMITFLERVAPAGEPYRHNVHTVDGRANAHAHLLGLFANASEAVPIVDGALLLGSWQSVFFVELDGPRDDRTVELHAIGEE